MDAKSGLGVETVFLDLVSHRMKSTGNPDAPETGKPDAYKTEKAQRLLQPQVALIQHGDVCAPYARP